MRDIGVPAGPALGSRAGLVIAGLVALGFLLAIAIGVWRDGEDPSAVNLPTATAEAGDVTVKATPDRIGPGDAVFTLSLAAQTSDFDFAVEDVARLIVDGVEWAPVTWDTTSRSGRAWEGRLEFRSRGPAEGRVVLELSGLPEPVSLSWNL